MEWRPGEILSLDTKRFTLRSLTPADATETYISWWNDPEVQAGLNSRARGWGKPEAVRHIAKFNNKTSFHLGIFCEQTGRMIGFFAIFIHPKNKVARTNIVIGEKDYWGKRVMEEVGRRMLSFLFETLGVAKVKAEVMGRNNASIFMSKVLGATCEGVLRKEIPHFSGGRTDIFVYGLLRDEWRAAQKAAVDSDSGT